MDILFLVLLCGGLILLMLIGGFFFLLIGTVIFAVVDDQVIGQNIDTRVRRLLERHTIQPYKVRGKMNITFLPNGEIPTPPAPALRIVTSINEALKVMQPDQKFGWHPDWECFNNDNIGKFEHMAVADTDADGKVQKYLYDIIAWFDGKLLPDGKRGQTEVFVPILRQQLEPGNPESPLEDWVIWFYEWRPAMRRWVISVVGGFDPASEEALEEAGLVVIPGSGKSTETCINRANVLTMVKVGFGHFQFGPEPKPEAMETIFKKARYATPLRYFPYTGDALIDSAVYYTKMSLGYTNQAVNIDAVVNAVKRTLGA